MRIYFARNSDKKSGQTCPHSLKNNNDHLIRVGSDDCKQCKYCIHYDVQHSLVPKNLISSVDDWYLPVPDMGMKQYQYADIGYIKCGYTNSYKSSFRLMIKKFLWRVVRLFQRFS